MIDAKALEAGGRAIWGQELCLDAEECMEAATACITAYLAAERERGFVMVPVEPTKDMLRAGARKSPPHGTYRAMIAAAKEGE